MIGLELSLVPEWRPGAGSNYGAEAEANGMEYDQDKVDEIILALLWLTSFKIRVVFEHGRGKTGIRWNDFTQRASSLISRAKPNRLS
jgi:hypothetical protein